MMKTSKNGILAWEANDDGILIYCQSGETPLPVSDWAELSIATKSGDAAHPSVLNLALEEEKCKETEDGFAIFLPHEFVADLEYWQVKALGLPETAPFRLEIQTKGAITNENFEVSYGFKLSDSRPVFGWYRRGSLLSYSQKSYLLTDPLYFIVENLDRFTASPITDMDKRFLWWSKISEILPENSDAQPFLKTFRVVKPDNFTVVVDDGGNDLNIVPYFLDPNKPGSEQNEISDPLLPQIVQADFQKQFLTGYLPKTRYALQNNWFVVLPPAIRRALEAVHELKCASPAERRAFLHNPRARLRTLLEDELSEEALESIFIESPLFLSERVKYLGIWEPKSGVYLSGERGQWLPGEELPGTVGLPLEDGLRTLPSQSLPELVTAMEVALDSGQNRITFNNEDIYVSRGNLDIIKSASQSLSPPVKPIKSQVASKEKKESKAQEVPIIHDNIAEPEVQFHAGENRLCQIDASPPLLNGIQLHFHQKQGLLWLQSHWASSSPGALLADDMGLGKTLMALALLSWIRNQKEAGMASVRPFLIVAPTGLLDNWQQEADKFLPQDILGEKVIAHGNKFRVSNFTQTQQATRLLQHAGWVLTTFETLRDKINAFVAVHWGAVVFDEAQKIKNPQALVTDMAKSLKADFTLCLTGTPVENSIKDLWCIVDAAQPGRLGSLKQFSDTYAAKGKNDLKKLEKLRDDLTKSQGTPQVLLRRSKEEHWQERPPKNEKIYEEIMPPAQEHAYIGAVNQARVLAGESGGMLEALHLLRKISLHPYGFDRLSDHKNFINESARLSKTISILDHIARDDEKALIFLESLELQTALAEILARRYSLGKVLIINGSVVGPKRQARVDQFQRGASGFDVMILSPKAGGVGLNLTAANHVIHLSRWWNPAVEDQCSDRAYRIGQTKAVTIHYPLAVLGQLGREQSFDIKLNELLEKKRKLSRDLLAPPAGDKNDIEFLFKQAVWDPKGNSTQSHNKKTLGEIDLMEPEEFERWVKRRLQNEQMEARLTQSSHDGGADIVAYENTGQVSLLVQCKHTQTENRELGPEPVQEVLNSRSFYGPEIMSMRLAVISNAAGFKRSAKKLAKKNQVILIGRDMLLDRWTPLLAD